MEPIEDLDVLSEERVRQREADDADEDLDRVKHGYDATAGDKQVYIETYGCQMNVNDSGIVASVLEESGYGLTQDEDEAD
ncbi:MAG: tRNA (N6-isopentenyl adenosine(37)-C2)-methylthiotransferase MiaB, partial [Salinibacter sp.]